MTVDDNTAGIKPAQNVQAEIDRLRQSAFRNIGGGAFLAILYLVALLCAASYATREYLAFISFAVVVLGFVMYAVTKRMLFTGRDDLDRARSLETGSKQRSS